MNSLEKIKNLGQNGEKNWVTDSEPGKNTHKRKLEQQKYFILSHPKI